MKRDYDTIAWFYDRLARLVYGRTLIDAQLFLLKAIPSDGHILIAGGGTGRILEEIAGIHASGLNITYIDASAKMLALARKRNAGGNKVTFITSPVEAAVMDTEYDVVITPFLFDNFTDDQLYPIFASINKNVKPNGLWLYCDFQDPVTFWQKALLKIMYLFFRLFCGIVANRLPDAFACFARYGYQLKEQRVFMNGFVISAIYEKQH